MREISVSLSVVDPPQEVMDYMSRLFGEVMRAGYQVTLSAVPVEYEDEDSTPPPPPPPDDHTRAIPLPSQDDVETQELPAP